jgi:hypothetical protein
MKKNELVEAIRANGIEANERQSKEELQSIYDKLHVHSIPEEKPEELSEEKPEELTEEKSEELLEEKPEEEELPEEKPEEVKNEFDLLQAKIEGAEIPPSKKPKEKPLIEKTRRKKSKKETSPDSFRIEGYILLLITDTFFPFTFSFINNLLDKKIKIEASDLQLSEKDFNKLEPLADQAADYMSVNLNPIAGFLIVSTFMYSNNLLSIRMQMTSQEKLYTQNK